MRGKFSKFAKKISTFLMAQTSNTAITISKVNNSKIDTVDFENLTFGTIFTDHMLVCDYEDEKWNTPEIKPYAPLQ